MWDEEECRKFFDAVSQCLAPCTEMKGVSPVSPDYHRAAYSHEKTGRAFRSPGVIPTLIKAGIYSSVVALANWLMTASLIFSLPSFFRRSISVEL